MQYKIPEAGPILIQETGKIENPHQRQKKISIHETDRPSTIISKSL